MRRITPAVFALLVSGCSFAGSFNPHHSEISTQSYEIARVCRSPDIDILIHLPRPIKNPTKELWEKDAILEIRVKRPLSGLNGVPNPVTLFWRDARPHDSEGRPLTRTFTDFPNELRDPTLEPETDAERERRIKDEYYLLFSATSTKPALSLKDHIRILRAVQAPYSELIDRCIYNF